MNKYIAGIFFTSALLGAFSSCTTPEAKNKIVINEVLVDNQENFQDDYGVHSGWVEIFNTSYNSVNLAGCYLKVSSEPGDTLSYFIPKGDVLTAISPRQHALFWADGAPRRGTFHTNFVLSKTKDNWIGLYDSGKKLLDEIVVPAGVLKTDQSYARISDGSDEWEVKDDSETKYVTPSTNNQTLEGNPKMDKFEAYPAVRQLPDYRENRRQAAQAQRHEGTQHHRQAGSQGTPAGRSAGRRDSRHCHGAA